MYKKLVRTDENGNIIAGITSDFIVDLDTWQEVGTTDMRQWHPELINDDGEYVYKLLNGKMVEI